MNHTVPMQKPPRSNAVVKGAVLVGVCALLSGCLPGECDRPLPPLLLNLSAIDEGDVWSPGFGLSEGKKQVFSPELTTRLQALFPAGSDAAAVERDLQSLGFKVISPCSNAPNARLAQLLQKDAVPDERQADLAPN